MVTVDAANLITYCALVVHILTQKSNKKSITSQPNYQHINHSIFDINQNLIPTINIDVSVPFFTLT